MYQSFGNEMTRGRMDERLRQAQAYRLGSETRAARAAGHRSTFRRIATIAAHALVWPIRH